MSVPDSHLTHQTARIIAGAGQPIGPSGTVISPNICKVIIEACKTGDIDKFTQELMRYNVQARDVTDSGQFGQNLSFAAVGIADEAKATAMLELIVRMGVDWF